MSNSKICGEFDIEFERASGTYMTNGLLGMPGIGAEYHLPQSIFDAKAKHQAFNILIDPDAELGHRLQLRLHFDRSG